MIQLLLESKLKKSFKKNKEIENYNENDNSTVSIINDKTKDAYSHAIRFSSVKKRKYLMMQVVTIFQNSVVQKK